MPKGKTAAFPGSAEGQREEGDLGISLWTDRVFAVPGDFLGYTISVCNRGTMPVTELCICVPLPAGSAYCTGSLRGAEGLPPFVTLPFSLLPGGRAEVSYGVQLGFDDVDAISNQARIDFCYGSFDGRQRHCSSKVVETKLRPPIEM